MIDGYPQLSSNFKKKAMILIIIILVQAILVISLGIVEYWHVFKLVEEKTTRYFAVFYIITGVVLSLIAVFVLPSVMKLIRIEAEADVNRIRLQETRQMIDVLRTQRHDFLNQLQVIYGLIQLGRVEIIKDYINQVNQEVQSSSKIFTSLLHKPEIAGLIMRKMGQAEAAGVSFSVDIRTDLMLLGVPPLDFARVLGNLIDNALDAVESVPPEERRIDLRMVEDEGYYEIKVINFRPLIPPESREKIFQKGYTTKKGKGEGLGLYIVKSLVEKNQGKIFVENNEREGTSFTLYFPMMDYSRIGISSTV